MSNLPQYPAPARLPDRPQRERSWPDAVMILTFILLVINLALTLYIWDVVHSTVQMVNG